MFTCIIPHTHFFTYILMFAFSINLLYLAASIYTLVWIAFKDCRKLSGHLAIYSKMCRDREAAAKGAEEKVGAAAASERADTERRADVFGGLNSPDVELLLDLLAETMGMAPAMRIMTMLDPELLKSWKVKRRKEVIAKEANWSAMSHRPMSSNLSTTERALPARRCPSEHVRWFAI